MEQALLSPQLNWLRPRGSRLETSKSFRWTQRSNTIYLPMLIVLVLTHSIGPSMAAAGGSNSKFNVKVGILLEESDHEQANMFIRTIKMINERRDETIRQLLRLSASNKGNRIDLPPTIVDPSTRNGNAPSSPAATSSVPAIEQDQFKHIYRETSSSRSRFNDDSWRVNVSYTNQSFGNTNNDDLPKNDQKQTPAVSVKLEPMIEFLSDGESTLEADSKVCQLIESGVRVIIGPVDGVCIPHVQSICDNLEIPYFELRPFLGGNPSFFANSGDGNMAGTSFAGEYSNLLTRTVAGAKNWSSEVNESAKKNDLGPLHDNDVATQRGNNGVPGSMNANNNPNGVEDEGYLGEDDHLDHLDDDLDSSIPVPHDYGDSKKSPSEAVKRPITFSSHSKPPVHSHDHTISSRQAFDTNTPTTTNRLEDLTLNLFPPAHLLNSAHIDLIYALNWTSFAIVYEDGSSMIKLQDLFRESSSFSKDPLSSGNKWHIRLFRLDPNNFNEVNHDRHKRSMPSDQEGSSNTSSRMDIGSANNNKHYEVNNDDRQNKRDIKATEFISTIDGGQLHGQNTRRVALDAANATAQIAESVRNAPILHENYRVNGQDNIINDQTSNKIDILQQDQPKTKDKEPGPTFRDVFWRVKASGEKNILLDVRTENLHTALKQAQQVGCMTEEYSYIVTSLDLHTIDLEDFRYSRTKITAFSILQVAKAHNSPLRNPLNQYSTLSSPTEQDGSDDLLKLNSPLFDEKYLENLGVHLAQQHNGQSVESGKLQSQQRSYKNGADRQSNNGKLKLYNGKQSVTQTHDKIPNSKISWTASEAAHNEWYKREMLQSSPASLGLLPTLDRNNEQRLFDFFLEQQERNLTRVRLSISSAILHDSLILYMLGLNELESVENLVGDHQSIACSLESQPWSYGSSLVNYMRRISFHGLTGPVSFDRYGIRKDFKLDLMGMAPNVRLIKIGEWHSKYAASSTAWTKSNQDNSADNSENPEATSQSYDELSKGYDLELKKYYKMLAEGKTVDVPYSKRASPNGALLVNDIIFERLYRDQADQIDTLIVTAKLSQPYFMLKETPNKLEGNDQFEGFAVDLIHELAKLVNFRYQWREVADKKYGSKEVLPNGTVVWNGMIGEIVRGQADLAIVDLTITAQREEAVDFTLPFMNTGISILFKKPTTKVTTLFSFLSPFSKDVWAYVLAAYCGISAILFLVGHISPYEWADPHPCRHATNDDDAVLKNQFSLLNSFWFTIGSLMQQGSDLTPRSMSTRTIAGIWYFFTLIMISSYTANLAAFLTVEKVVYPIENVRDLSDQQEIKYGCVESGSTCLFFHDSQIDTYKKIDETMRRHKTYVRSNDEGQKKVGEGKFAFFMESTTIEYIIERNCNLTQIGGLMDSKGYGLATSKKSRLKRPYRTLLNEGILHLQETGMLHVLKNRWWKEKRGGGTCTDDGKGGGVTNLSLANVGGVFVVLLGGLGISFLVAIAEFMWHAKRSGSTRDRMCEEMMNDLKFALACKSSTKPMRKKYGQGKRLVHQQTSLLSQSEELDSKAMPNQQFDTKDCDPILLHAMFTMLQQQSQQQLHSMNQLHEQVAKVPEKGQTSIETMANELEYRKRVLGNKQMVPTKTIAHKTFHPFGSSSSSGNYAAANIGGNNGNGLDQYQSQWISTRSGASADHAIVSGSRKRVLHAQSTIDTADDGSMGNFSGQIG